MNFKKCYPLTDRTKSRDAVASKKQINERKSNFMKTDRGSTKLYI